MKEYRVKDWESILTDTANMESFAPLIIRSLLKATATTEVPADVEVFEKCLSKYICSLCLVRGVQDFIIEFTKPSQPGLHDVLQEYINRVNDFMCGCASGLNEQAKERDLIDVEQKVYDLLKRSLVKFEEDGEEEGEQEDRRQEFYVDCPTHGKTPLTNSAYTKQLLKPEEGWSCSICGVKATLYEGE